MSLRSFCLALLFVMPLAGYAQFIPGTFDFESEATNLFAHNGKLWVSTANNGMFVSDNAGITWIKKWQLNYLGGVNRLENNGLLKVNQVVVFQGVFFGCTAHGLYRSTDEGQNWHLLINFQVINPGYGNLIDVSVRNVVFSPSKAIALLENGSIATSTDGGNSWSSPYIIPEVAGDSQNSIQFVSWVNNKWYSLTTKRLLTSSDDALTWQNIPLITNRNFSAVSIEPGRMVISAYADSLVSSTYYGRSFTLFLSTDNGQSWNWTTSLAGNAQIGGAFPTGFTNHEGNLYVTIPGDVLRRDVDNTSWKSIREGTIGPERGVIQANPLVLNGSVYTFVCEPTTSYYVFTYRMYRRPLAELTPPFFAAPILPVVIENSDYRNQLKWYDVSVDEDGFEVERSDQNATSFRVIGTVSAGTTDFIDGRLAVGTTYYYRIRARKGNSYSAYSTVVKSIRSTSCYQIKERALPRCIDRINSAVMYALAGDELARSDDGGKQWRPVNVCDGGFDGYNDLSFPTATSGFLIVRNQAHLLKTNDGGQSWQRLTPFKLYANMTFIAMHFFNDSIGYILAKQTGLSTGYSLLKTTDGGVSLKQVPNIPANFDIDDNGYNSPLRLKPSFIGDSIIVGLAKADNYNSLSRLLISTDAGATWQRRPIPSNGSFSRQLYALSAQNIWLLGRNATGQYQYSDNVLHTTDGGLTWSTIALPDRVDEQYHPIQLYDIRFSDAQHGFIIGGRGGTFTQFGQTLDEGFIYYTGDGGLNWQLVNTGTTPQTILRKLSVYGNHITIYGEGSTQNFNHLVLTSTNLGMDWNRTEAEQVSPYSIAFRTPREGYVVGTSIVKVQGFNFIDFVLARVSFFHKTTDGGFTWQKVQLPTTEPLYEVYFLNTSVGFITSNQSVWITTDGGQSWQQKITPALFSPEINPDGNFSVYGQYFKRSYFINQTTWIRISNDYRTFKTVDGGNTWTQLPTPAFTTIPHFSFVSNNIGYCTGVESNVKGQVYKTTDGGQSWTVVGHGGGMFAYPFDIYFLNEQKGFVNDQSGLRTTYDGGKTWVNFVQRYKGGRFLFATDKIGYCTGSLDEGVLQTIDGGDTWHLLPSKSVTTSADGMAALADSVTLNAYKESFRAGSPLCQPVPASGDTIYCMAASYPDLMSVQAGSFDRQLKYQWYRAADDTPIPGQTYGTLSLTSVSPQAIEEYYCVVSNNCSTVRSRKLTMLGSRAVCTRKAGRWDDPTVWSCSRLPTGSDRVILRHNLVIPNQFTAQAGTVDFYAPKVRLRYTGRAVIKTSTP